MKDAMQQAPDSMLHPNLQVTPGDRLAFLHIPKTAGTSLTRALATHWGRVKIIGDNRILREMAPDGLKNISLFAGHFYAHQLNHPALAGFTPITVLRDPLARLFSEYRFASTVAKLGQPLPPRMQFALKVSFFEYAFSEWGTAGRHSQLFILGAKAPPYPLKSIPLGDILENAKRVVSQMRVGVTDNLEGFVTKLFSEVGAPAPPLLNLNTQERHLEYPLSKRQLETLRDVLAPDFALYAFARQLMNNWISGSIGTRTKTNPNSVDPHAIKKISPNVNGEDPLLISAEHAFKQKDWATVCRIFSKKGIDQMPEGSLKKYTSAALELGEPEHINRALRWAIINDLTIGERLEIAQLFNVANLPHEAWDIFVSAYHFFDYRDTEKEHLFITAGSFLIHVANSPSATDRLRQVVWQYRLRMKNMVQEPLKLAPIQFRTSTPRALLTGQETDIFCSNHVPEKAIGAYEEQAKIFPVWRQKVRNTFVREYRNVFVNRIGQIWRPDGKILRDCMRQLPTASQQAAAFAQRVPIAGLAISSHNDNFYHWMADMVPSIAWRLEGEADNIPLIIRDDASSFMRESLHVLGEGSISLEEAGDAIFVERLYEGEQAGAKLQPDGAHYAVITKLRLAADQLIGDIREAGSLIYISRRDSKLRSMSNEEELEDAVAKIGFQIVRLSSLNLRQQVSTIRQAKFVLGPHGAGFTHILFAQPDTFFFEITPYEAGTEAQRYCMARLSRIMGNRHAIWLELTDTATKSWSASIDPIINKVTELLRAMRASPTSQNVAR